MSFPSSHAWNNDGHHQPTVSPNLNREGYMSYLEGGGREGQQAQQQEQHGSFVGGRGHHHDQYNYSNSHDGHNAEREHYHHRQQQRPHDDGEDGGYHQHPHNRSAAAAARAAGATRAANEIDEFVRNQLEEGGTTSTPTAVNARASSSDQRPTDQKRQRKRRRRREKDDSNASTTGTSYYSPTSTTAEEAAVDHDDDDDDDDDDDRGGEDVEGWLKLAKARHDKNAAKEKLLQAQKQLEELTNLVEEKSAAYEQVQKEALDDILQSGDSPWCVMYRLLVKYKEEHGDCLVPRNDKRRSNNDKLKSHPEYGKLGTWVYAQRVAYRNAMPEDENDADASAGNPSESTAAVSSSSKGKATDSSPILEEWQIEALNRIGFTWKPKFSMWSRGFEEVVAFKKEHGHFNVPIKHPLYGWIKRQNLLRNNLLTGKGGTYTETTRDHVRQLEAIGFFQGRNRGGTADDWEVCYKQYLNFKNGKKKDAGTKRKEVSVKQKRLYSWVMQQRADYSARFGAEFGTLLFEGSPAPAMTDARLKLLDDAGFDFGNGPKLKFNRAWEKLYVLLKAYHGATGHCDVPPDYRLIEGLSDWVAEQREDYARKQEEAPHYLTDRKIALLNEIKFKWDVEEEEEEDDLQAKDDEPTGKKKAGTSSTVRGKKDDRWEEHFVALRHYHDAHRDCNVIKHNDSLRMWLNEQREDYRWFMQLGRKEKPSALQRSRFEKLRTLPIDFSNEDGETPDASRWNKLFLELLRRRILKGSFETTRKQCPELHDWKEEVRYQYKNALEGKMTALSQERIYHLHRAGFHEYVFGMPWTRTRSFEDMCLEFLFHQINHGTDAEVNYKRDPGLKAWVGKNLRDFPPLKEEKTWKYKKLKRIGFELVYLDHQMRERRNLVGESKEEESGETSNDGGKSKKKKTTPTVARPAATATGTTPGTTTGVTTSRVTAANVNIGANDGPALITYAPVWPDYMSPMARAQMGAAAAATPTATATGHLMHHATFAVAAGTPAVMTGTMQTLPMAATIAPPGAIYPPGFVPFGVRGESNGVVGGAAQGPSQAASQTNATAAAAKPASARRAEEGSNRTERQPSGNPFLDVMRATLDAE